MEEVTQKVKRSELYNEIYAIVKQIPRANVDSDCMDASSASGAIEKLIASRGSRTLSAVPSAKEIDKMANELYEKDEITDRLSFIFGAEWIIEEIKRGIAG